MLLSLTVISSIITLVLFFYTILIEPKEHIRYVSAEGILNRRMNVKVAVKHTTSKTRKIANTQKKAAKKFLVISAVITLALIIACYIF